jgi:hypothetical protein
MRRGRKKDESPDDDRKEGGRRGGLKAGKRFRPGRWGARADWLASQLISTEAVARFAELAQAAGRTAEGMTGVVREERPVI